MTMFSMTTEDKVVGKRYVTDFPCGIQVSTFGGVPENRILPETAVFWDDRVDWITKIYHPSPEESLREHHLRIVAAYGLALNEYQDKHPALPLSEYLDQMAATLLSDR